MTLSEIIGRPEIPTHPHFNTQQARDEHYEELKAAIEGWTKQRDKHEVMRILAGRGIACGPVLNTVEVLANPHLRERGMIYDIEHPRRGKRSLIGCPVRMSGSPVEYRPAPGLGEHVEEVLVNLAGYKPEDIERLRRDQVL